MGEEFVKKIRPLGCALFLIAAVLVTAVCFTAGRDPIKGYEPPESSEYYSEHLSELQAELEENVFPELEGVVSCREENGVLVVELQKDSYAVTRSALLRYYGESLFELVEVE